MAGPLGREDLRDDSRTSNDNHNVVDTGAHSIPTDAQSIHSILPKYLHQATVADAHTPMHWLFLQTSRMLQTDDLPIVQ